MDFQMKKNEIKFFNDNFLLFLLFSYFFRLLFYFYLLMYFGPRAGNPARGPVRAAKMGCGPAGRGLRAWPVTTSIQV